MIRTLALLLGGFAFLLLTGCSTPSYVNIPAQGGDLARSNPNADDIRAVMATAITAAVDHERLIGPFEVVLPAGSDQETYEHVVLAVGGGAITPDTLRDRPVPTVRVGGIRIRNRAGEVDMVRPSPTGRQVLTVYLNWYYGGGWQVERVRLRRVDPEKFLPPMPGDVPMAVPPGALPRVEVPAEEVLEVQDAAVSGGVVTEPGR